MLINRFVIPLVLVGTLIVLSGCGEAPDSKPETVANVDRRSDEVLSNPEELGLLMRVPFESDEIEDIAWKSNPDSRSLVAVIRLTEDGAKRADAEVFQGRSNGRGSIDVKSWFPKELLTKSEMNGDADLDGTLLPIDALILPPYNSGRVVKIDDSEYYVIEMSAN